jgi:hypothetical protein
MRASVAKVLSKYQDKAIGLAMHELWGNV